MLDTGWPGPITLYYWILINEIFNLVPLPPPLPLHTWALGSHNFSTLHYTLDIRLLLFTFGFSGWKLKQRDRGNNLVQASNKNIDCIDCVYCKTMFITVCFNFSWRRISPAPSWVWGRCREPPAPAPPSTWRGSSPPPPQTGSHSTPARRWASAIYCVCPL